MVSFLVDQNTRRMALILQASNSPVCDTLLDHFPFIKHKISWLAWKDIASGVYTAHFRPSATGGPTWTMRAVARIELPSAKARTASSKMAGSACSSKYAVPYLIDTGVSQALHRACFWP